MKWNYNSSEELQPDYQEYLQEKKAEGKKLIAYFAHEFVPDELIHSVGAIPVPLIYAGDEDRTALGSGYLTPTMCPFALSQLGAFFVHKETGQYRFLSLIDALIVTNYCTAAQLTAEMITDQFKIPRFDLHIPYLQTDAHRVYYQSELERLGKELAIFTQHPYSDAELQKEIEEYTQLESLLNSLAEKSIKASELIKIRYTAKLFGPDPTLLAGLKTFLEKAILVPTQDMKVSKKIILTGCAVFIDDPLVNFIEECGGDIIFNDTWIGDQNLFNNHDPDQKEKTKNQSPLELLAQRFQSNIYSSHCAPNYVANYVSKIIELTKRTHTKAIVNHILKFCDVIGHHRQEIKEQLNDADIQVLTLERDYSKSMSGQLRTRIEAFMEMID